MRIAIPLTDGKLAMHFGHCQRFALLDVEPSEKKIVAREDVDAPPHQPGLLPPWLAEYGVETVIAGGMGQHAQELLKRQKIEVVLGAAIASPEELVTDYLTGTLSLSQNACEGHGCNH